MGTESVHEYSGERVPIVFESLADFQEYLATRKAKQLPGKEGYSHDLALADPHEFTEEDRKIFESCERGTLTLEKWRIYEQSCYNDDDEFKKDIPDGRRSGIAFLRNKVAPVISMLMLEESEKLMAKIESGQNDT